MGKTTAASMSLLQNNVAFDKYGVIKKPQAKTPTVVNIPMAPPKSGNYVLQPGCSELKIGDYLKKGNSEVELKNGYRSYRDNNGDGKIDVKRVKEGDVTITSTDKDYDGKTDSKKRSIYFKNSQQPKEVLFVTQNGGTKKMFTKTGQLQSEVKTPPLSAE